MRYGAEILKWNTDELKSSDKRIRKFMTMQGALHTKSGVVLTGYILVGRWEEGY